MSLCLPYFFSARASPQKCKYLSVTLTVLISYTDELTDLWFFWTLYSMFQLPCRCCFVVSLRTQTRCWLQLRWLVVVSVQLWSLKWKWDESTVPVCGWFRLVYAAVHLHIISAISWPFTPQTSRIFNIRMTSSLTFSWDNPFFQHKT